MAEYRLSNNTLFLSPGDEDEFVLCWEALLRQLPPAITAPAAGAAAAEEAEEAPGALRASVTSDIPLEPLPPLRAFVTSDNPLVAEQLVEDMASAASVTVTAKSGARAGAGAGAGAGEGDGGGGGGVRIKRARAVVLSTDSLETSHTHARSDAATADGILKSFVDFFLLGEAHLALLTHSSLFGDAAVRRAGLQQCTRKYSIGNSVCTDGPPPSSEAAAHQAQAQALPVRCPKPMGHDAIALQCSAVLLEKGAGTGCPLASK
jgi:hypothetical protein